MPRLAFAFRELVALIKTEGALTNPVSFTGSPGTLPPLPVVESRLVFGLDDWQRVDGGLLETGSGVVNLGANSLELTF